MRGFVIEPQTLEVHAPDVVIRAVWQVVKQSTLLQVLPELCLQATSIVLQRRQTEQISVAPLHMPVQEVQADIMGYQPTRANPVIW